MQTRSSNYMFELCGACAGCSLNFVGKTTKPSTGRECYCKFLSLISTFSMYTNNVQNNWHCGCINRKLGKTTKLPKTTLFAFENKVTLISAGFASLQLNSMIQILPWSNTSLVHCFMSSQDFSICYAGWGNLIVPP